MENAVQTQMVNPLDLVVAPQEPSKALAEVTSQDWVPLLSICHPMSKTFKDKIAQPGEFVLGGSTSIGPKIEVIVLDWRVHAALSNNKTKTFEGHCYVHSSWAKERQAKGESDSLVYHEQFNAFTKQQLKPGYEIVIGPDIFVYIPAVNNFGCMFFKKTLAASGSDLQKSGAGGRLVQIESVEKTSTTSGNSWYVTKSVPLRRAIVGSTLPGVEADIKIPVEALTKYYNLFKSPKAGAEYVEESQAAPVRDR